MERTEIRITGFGGQGVVLIGYIIGRAWSVHAGGHATMIQSFGPEARGSSPVRVVRDETTRQTPGVEGLYPVGEGAGYAGGIVSAAVDGLRTAKAVISLYPQLDPPSSP